MTGGKLMRILLSGNQGYLGSVLEPLLLESGHHVVGLDAGFFQPSSAQPRRDVRHAGEHDVSGCDAVINAAAICNDACGDLSSPVTHQINHQAALRLARLARSARVPIFVQISSCSVYGAARDMGVDEVSPVAPQTAYAWSKIAAERSLALLATADFTPVVLRLATLFGPAPSFRSDILLNRMVGTALRQGVIQVSGNGSMCRPLLHVVDAARAIAQILQADPSTLTGRLYNVGANEQNCRLRDLAEQTRGVFPEAVVSRVPAADHRSYQVRFDRFRTRFSNWSPRTTPADSIASIRDHYRSLLAEGLPGGDVQGQGNERWGVTDRREHLVSLRASGALQQDFRWAGH
jgi:nucleoside-diphosphate-sugar epimerase